MNIKLKMTKIFVGRQMVESETLHIVAQKTSDLSNQHHWMPWNINIEVQPFLNLSMYLNWVYWSIRFPMMNLFVCFLFRGHEDEIALSIADWFGAEDDLFFFLNVFGAFAKISQYSVLYNLNHSLISFIQD
ncbi:hypothetical protein ACJX0J_030941 [Zea mays]